MRTFMNRRAAALAAVVIAGVVGLTGCGGEDPAADSPAPPAVAATGEACKLITLAEATGAVGAGLKVAADDADGCTYATDDGLKSVDVKVETMAYDPTQVTEVKTMLDAKDITDLSGLGEAAFSFQATANLTQVYVWGKGRFLEVFVASAEGKTGDAAKDLTQKAYGRL